MTLLTEAAGGQYWTGRWRHVDLDARWHVMRVTIDEADADLDGAHVDGHHSKRVEARELIEATRDYLAQVIGGASQADGQIHLFSLSRNPMDVRVWGRHRFLETLDILAQSGKIRPPLGAQLPLKTPSPEY